VTRVRGDNEQRLRDEGMILTEGPLEGAHADAVEGLTPDELDVLIAVNKRLEAADVQSGHDAPIAGQPAPYMALIRF
jgi:hypothetical protein